MRFYQLCEDKQISGVLNNGDFDYWLVCQTIDWIDTVGPQEAPATYNVCISVVAPSQAPEAVIRSACESCGVHNVTTPMMLVDILHGYGLAPTLWQQNGNNLRQLHQEGREYAALHGDMLFGFAMDKPQNAMGTTGWEWIRGEL